MSGAQAIAAVITGCIGIIAEVDGDMVQQRLTDGYIKKDNVFSSLDTLIARLEECRRDKTAITLFITAIYRGSLGTFCKRQDCMVELGSDQTSCHNIHDLGYCPVGYTYEEAKLLLIKDKEKFKKKSGPPCAGMWKPS